MKSNLDHFTPCNCGYDTVVKTYTVGIYLDEDGDFEDNYEGDVEGFPGVKENQRYFCDGCKKELTTIN